MADIGLQATSASIDLLRSLDFLWLEVTNRCNLKCVHCYSSSSPTEPESTVLKLSDWVCILKDARALGCRKVQFIGGEPLLYKGLPVLIEEARSLNYEMIEVYSNGTRLTDEMARLFSDHGVMLATSFYSDDPCVHDAITRSSGSHKRTISALRKAVQYDIQTRVGVVVMDHNREGLEGTLNFIRSLGIVNIGVDKVRGIGRASSSAIIKTTYEELCGKCWRGTLAVNSYGDVSPCVFSHFHNVGNVNEGLGSILKRDELLQFRNKVNYIDKRKGDTSCRPVECHPMGCDPTSCSPNSCTPNSCTPN